MSVVKVQLRNHWQMYRQVLDRRPPSYRADMNLADFVT